MVRKFGIVIGALWLAYSADLLIRETGSVISGSLLLSSYLKTLIQVALLVLSAALLIRALEGRAVISVVVTSFIALGYFVFLSNTWYEAGFDTWFAVAVIALFALTVLHAVLVWVAPLQSGNLPPCD